MNMVAARARLKRCLLLKARVEHIGISTAHPKRWLVEQSAQAIAIQQPENHTSMNAKEPCSPRLQHAIV